MRIHLLAIGLTAPALILVATGCEQDENARIAAMAEKQLARQAEDARRASELQREVAEGSRRLVEADAAARLEIATAQREMQAERIEVGRQRDQLETERRELAIQRRFDPVVAEAITGASIVLACLMPLLLCWYLLQQPVQPVDDSVVAEILLEDLIIKRPLLMTAERNRNIGCSSEPPPALTDEQSTSDETPDENNT